MIEGRVIYSLDAIRVSSTSITKIPNERRSITLRVISMCLLVQAAWRLLQYAGLVYHLEFHRQQP